MYKFDDYKYNNKMYAEKDKTCAGYEDQEFNCPDAYLGGLSSEDFSLLQKIINHTNLSIYIETKPLTEEELNYMKSIGGF